MAGWSQAIYHRQNGRYYKYQDTCKGLDILDADNADALEKGSRDFHDHFFKRDGTWYVQSKIDGSHLFEELRPGVSGVNQVEAGEYLDYLFQELQRLG